MVKRKALKTPASLQRAKTASKKSKASQGSALPEDMYDEVEQFHYGRDKISLNAADSSDDSEDSEEEEVLDLPGYDDSDEEEDDDEEEEEDEDEDEDDVDEDSDGIMTEKAWGRKKSAFYSTDYIDEDLGSDYNKSDEEAEEEEIEALRMQKAQAAQLDEEDFFGAPQLIGKKKGKSKKVSAEDVAASVSDELDTIQIGKGAEIITITKDVSNLSEAEKIEMIMNDSPELLELLADFKDAMQEIRSQLYPILQAGPKGCPSRVHNAHHADYLNVKYHLLLSYCTNISYYLLLKSSGKPVKDHPVIRQLVRQREMIAALRTVDAETARQVDILLREASGSDSIGNTVVSIEKSASKGRKQSTESKKSETQNRKRRISVHDESHDEDEKLTVKKNAFSAKPKKVAYTGGEFQPGEGSKRKVLGSLKRKAALADFGESGESTIAVSGKHKVKASKMEQESEKTRSKASRSAEDDVPRKQMREQSSGRGENIKFDDDGSDGYEDLPGGSQKGKKKNAIEFGAAIGDEEDGGGEEDYYEVVRSSRKKRKEERDAAHERVADYLPEEEAEEKRGVNWQIQKNKGLTPHRKIKNPRVKHKIKFAKAQVKRKHQVRQVQAGAAGASYGGETSGLKKNLARSVKM